MKFTIRDLLWLTVVVALGVGWWIHARRLDHVAKAAEERLKSQEERLKAYMQLTKAAAHSYSEKTNAPIVFRYRLESGEFITVEEDATQDEVRVLGPSVGNRDKIRVGVSGVINDNAPPARP